MEENLLVLVKKVWNLVRVVYFMLRKGISKRKLLLDINMMFKRGKIAGKALQNLMFNHHNNRRSPNSHHIYSFPSPPPSEDEFSCTNSPIASALVMQAMDVTHSEMGSPALPRFARSPVVRQLRVTDSPFPLNNVDGDNHVDEAAEQFISRFYNDLLRQNIKTARFGSS